MSFDYQPGVYQQARSRFRARGQNYFKFGAQGNLNCEAHQASKPGLGQVRSVAGAGDHVSDSLARRCLISSPIA